MARFRRSEGFTVWFISGSIELKVGGAYAFGGADPDFAGRVIAIDPPRFIRFSGGPGHVQGGENGWFQFELSEVKGETRTVFTRHVPGGRLH